MSVKPFNNPDVVVQSWYLIARSRELQVGKVLSRDMLGRSFALWRDEGGQVRVLNARCPHLGADMGQGDLVDGELRCPFHHWSYDGAGRCVRVPYMDQPPSFARAFAYPTVERHGQVWIWNGLEPGFELPHFDRWDHADLRAVRLPPQSLACHPHLAASNGLDIQHFSTVHQFAYWEPPRLEVLDEHRVRVQLSIKIRGHNLFERALRKLAGDRGEATFTTWGGNMALIEAQVGPVPVLVWFNHSPIPGGGSASQTLLFRPRGGGLRRGLRDELLLNVAKLIMGYILLGDRDLVDRLQYRPRFVEQDAPAQAFFEQVNAMPIFDPERDWRPQTVS